MIRPPKAQFLSECRYSSTSTVFLYGCIENKSGTSLLSKQPMFLLVNTCEYIYTITVSNCKARRGQLSYSCESPQNPPVVARGKLVAPAGQIASRVRIFPFGAKSGRVKSIQTLSVWLETGAEIGRSDF